MAAPVLIIDDDDDEFDWEAAVQEIDVACQKTGDPASFSSWPPRPPQTSAPVVRVEESDSGKDPRGQPNGFCKNSRQMTLDRFMNRNSDLTLNARMKRIKELEEQEEARPEADNRGRYVDIDPEAAKTWIYPENVPRREYQLAITRKALFSNTLVALPTGLGKTLIAAVVMYNYFRWFPEGKIVFAAPSRPLVMQQIEACHNIVGIPQEWTIDMTGQTTPAKRACLWKEKRVFFVTPQVLEKDIQSGTCLVKYLVCLVIDEAHRAMGNYSYCVAVRELMAVPVQLRILALTATPGSKQQTIQQVIDNLQISTLEYRNESDPDVVPYVHNRKLELIEVPMGQNAIEINSLLLDVIRPMATRLSSMGVLPSRDFQTLSPCDLLTSRDKFRQAPPPDLSHVKYGEVEGYFGVLITLYHIRKLLSSHGIRPAYEMLEEKFRQGSFARLMSKNECIHQVRLLMQRSVTNGAPSPKLSKLMEVLVDHFENNDPESSRVIIFSNFRGSVRDIMDALSNLGNHVKPTEFIGQSSGKTLKGQTQKVQQAVLEKFRRGGYNVIVATSIGEEGLDIMEVDLVICFDANVSPLRMIQRMGRTGRKHDGRVVVLACEGSELKGYMRKQASGKAVRKHMRNGGMNSFTFHPSPRMVPHIFKPEQKCLKLSITEFVPRGKKVKDDSVSEPNFLEKLTDDEALILARYFSHKENTLKPSLIAFPQFQAFPSGVHMVKHSSRTGMLIDTMQHLQGQSCAWNKPSCDFEDQDSPGHCAAVGSTEKVNNIEDKPEELSNAEVSSSCALINKKLGIPNSADEVLGTTNPAPGTSFGKQTCDETTSLKVLDAMVSPSNASESKECLPVPKASSAPCCHSFLFCSEIASVDYHGRVLVASVPILALNEISFSESPIARNTTLLNCSGQVAADSEALPGDTNELLVQTTAFVAPSPCAEARCKNAEAMLRSQSPAHAEMKILLNFGDERRLNETANMMIPASPEFPDHLNDDEVDLSPRLTNFIKSGCVPESPLNGFPNSGKETYEIVDLEPIALVTSSTLPAPSSANATKDEGVSLLSSPCTKDVRNSLVVDQAFTPVLKAAKSAINGEGSCDGAKELRTPLGNLTNSPCSRDWYMSSSEKSVGAEKTCKFKRLRKIGDSKSCNGLKRNSGGCFRNFSRKFSPIAPNHSQPDKGDQETSIDVRDLIQEEAEVSSEAEVSADEEDDQEDDTYEDSFIDDRVYPTVVSEETQDCGIDMMAIYRRSLLSQSPVIRQQKHSSYATPESVASATRITQSLDSCGETERSLQTPQSITKHGNLSSRRNSVCSKLEKIAEEAMPSTSGRTQISNTTTSTDSRKRKFRSHDFHVPAINLEKEFSSRCDTPGKESSLEGEANENDPAWNLYLDDQFYEGLDLDELEAQAAKLLGEKTGSSAQKESVSEPNQPRVDILGSPSFDLGIS